MKKVLSFVLVLSLVLSSFSMAFAGETKATGLSDVAGAANEEAINVVNDLGIVTGYTDGTFKAEKAVNRAEFAVMITKALGVPESALAGYTATNFTDVAGYEWAVPYLAFCESKGIMSGYGEGIVKPGNTITVNEAMAMALRAVGYTPNSAELVGTWPSNYVTKAQDLDLYEDVQAVATIDRGSAAQVIYNTLTVQKVAVDADGTTNKMWLVEPNGGIPGVPTNLLTSGLDCSVLENDGVVDLNDADKAVINLVKYLGQYGDLYQNDKTGEIVAFMAEGTTLTGKFTANDEFTTADGTTYTVKDTTIDEVVNVAAGTAAPATVAQSATTYTISAKVVGKTITDVYGATIWTVSDAMFATKAHVAEIAEDQEILGKAFILDENEEIDETSFVLVGATSLDKIAEDDVVYVFCDNNAKVRMVVVGTEEVTGVVKNFKAATSTSTSSFAIGANVYKNAVGLVNGVAASSEDTEVSALDVAEEVVLYLDGFGTVFAHESTASIDNYAVVLKTDNGITNQAKVLFADGNEKVVEFDVDADEWNAITGASLGAGSVLFGYDLDKDGVVVDVTTTGHVTVGSATLESISVVRTQSGAGKYIISDDVVVFTYDSADGGSYDVAKIADLETEVSLEGSSVASVVLKLVDGEVVAMIIDASATKSGDASFAIFNEYTKTAKDDDAVYEVIGYKDGAKFEALTDDTTTFATSPVYSNGNVIRLYEVVVDAEGTVIETTLMVDNNTDVEQYTGTVNAAEARKTITLTGSDAGIYALDAEAVIYKLTDGEYSVYNGTVMKNDVCYFYNLNADEDATIDVVVFERP